MEFLSVIILTQSNKSFLCVFDIQIFMFYAQILSSSYIYIFKALRQT